MIHPEINGNKFRKLRYLIDANPKTIEFIISYGGAQSNAMAALARLCRYKKWEFHYFTTPIAGWQKENPAGNLANALKDKMRLHEVRGSTESLRQEALQFAEQTPRGKFVPQGAATCEAEAGLRQLANEIELDCRSLQIRPVVFISSGTGTSALYLARHLPGIEVHTLAALGSASHLKEQMQAIEGQMKGQIKLPPNLTIREPPAPDYRFARPRREFLATWKELLPEIEFDLIYDIPAWHYLGRHFTEIHKPAPAPAKRSAADGNPKATGNENWPYRPFFIHSGGVEGNVTQLARYRRAFGALALA